MYRRDARQSHCSFLPQFFAASLSLVLSPCSDMHNRAGQLHMFELCVCAHLQVPEYVRLCLHDVAEVRPLS